MGHESCTISIVNIVVMLTTFLSYNFDYFENFITKFWFQFRDLN